MRVLFFITNNLLILSGSSKSELIRRVKVIYSLVVIITFRYIAVLSKITMCIFARESK